MYRFFTVVFLTLFSIPVFAQKDPIEKIWLTQEKSSKVQIFKATDGKYYGKIVWLKTPYDAKGKPRTDIHNSNESQHHQPLLNLIMLKGFSKTTDTENIFEGGTIYDPNNGKTYCGKLTLKGAKIHMRGFLCSFSFLGRTTTWTLSE